MIISSRNFGETHHFRKPPYGNNGSLDSSNARRSIHTVRMPLTQVVGSLHISNKYLTHSWQNEIEWEFRPDPRFFCEIICLDLCKIPPTFAAEVQLPAPPRIVCQLGAAQLGLSVTSWMLRLTNAWGTRLGKISASLVSKGS